MGAVKARSTAVEKYWEKVVKGDGCWGWTDKPDKNGYGLLGVGSRAQGTLRQVRAHRFSWELHNGPIPDGLWVLHHCDNPPCTNPEHLYLGTVVENGRDRKQRRTDLLKTHCAQGHEYTPENTLIDADKGTRRCRVCHNKHSRLWYQRVHAKT